jgi:hypothetical protein
LRLKVSVFTRKSIVFALVSRALSCHGWQR